MSVLFSEILTEAGWDDTRFTSFWRWSILDLSPDISKAAASFSDSSFRLVAVNDVTSWDIFWHCSLSITISLLLAVSSSDNPVLFDLSRNRWISSSNCSTLDACALLIFSFSLSMAATNSLYDVSDTSTIFFNASTSANVTAWVMLFRVTASISFWWATAAKTRSFLSWSRSFSISLMRRIKPSTSCDFSTLLAL